MASNAELKEKIAAIDPDADVEGLNNAQLGKLLKELKASEDPEPAADPAPAPEPAAEPVAATSSKGGHVVAKGKAITTGRGILGGGESISVKDISGGQSAFDALVKAGAIVKG